MPSIGYQFKSSGSRQVIKDFDDIGTAARKSRQESEKAPRAPAASRGVGQSPVIKAAEAEAKALAAIEKRKLADIKKAASESQKLRIKSYKAESRALEAAERERQKRLDQIVDAKKKKRERDRKNFAASAWNGIGSAGSAILGLGGAAVAGGIALGGASYAKRSKEFETAQQLSTSGRGAGDIAVDPHKLLADATRSAISVRGTKTADVLAGQQRYVQMTGDLEGAQRMSKTFATAARATGSSETDIAATAATMKDKFGIDNDADMKDALAKMSFQGKKGAFEMGDASRYFAEMGAAGQMFGAGIGKGGKGVAVLGGLAQIARGAKGSGAEASTATQAMLRQLVAKSDLIKQKTGASVFADKGKTVTNDVQETLVKTISGAKGNQELIQKIFGDEGKGAVAGLVSAYNEAARAVGKDATAKERTTAGEAAMRDMLNEAINAGGSWTEMQQDAAANTNNASAKLTTAWEKASSAVGDKMTPGIDALAESLEGIDFTALGDATALLMAAFSDAATDLAKLFGFAKGDKPAPADARDEAPVATRDANRAQQAALKKLSPTASNRAKMRELKAKEDQLTDQIEDETNPWVVHDAIVEGTENGVPVSNYAEHADLAQVDKAAFQRLRDEKEAARVAAGPDQTTIAAGGGSSSEGGNALNTLLTSMGNLNPFLDDRKSNLDLNKEAREQRVMDDAAKAGSEDNAAKWGKAGEYAEQGQRQAALIMALDRATNAYNSAPKPGDPPG